MNFEGNLFGFKYNIDKKDEAEFKIWLKAKILRYIFNMKEGTDMKSIKTSDSIELQILKEIMQGDYT